MVLSVSSSLSSSSSCSVLLLRRLVRRGISGTSCCATTSSRIGLSSRQPYDATSRSFRWASTLVVSDPLLPNGQFPASTQSAVTAAQQWNAFNDSNEENSVLLLLVTAAETMSLPTQIPTGVTRILHATTTTTSSLPTAETVAAATASAVLQQQQQQQSSSNVHNVLGASTKFGSTILPRIAALLNVSPVTDVIDITSHDTFVRPIYAGNALAKVQATDSIKVITIRPTCFEKAPLTERQESVEVETISLEAFEHSEWVRASSSSSGSGRDRPDLSSASIVVSGGRGMKSGEHFGLLERMGDALAASSSSSGGSSGAAIGASRAAVDAGMVPNDYQVGQTGKVVAPDLYVAVGISGAIQHLSGMKDSKTIVAINKDPDAPIFQVADYGLVADLFDAVPEITNKISKN